jgi:hypothetical protein
VQAGEPPIGLLGRVGDRPAAICGGSQPGEEA